VYALVEGLEAFGLWYQRRWAEYLTFLVTTSLLPLEVYELAHSLSPLKLLTFVINVAVVAYLLFAKRLFGIRGGVAADERERTDMRALLNFGHTIGHAIEHAAGYGNMLHGEAISLGLIAAAHVSVQRAGLSLGAAEKIRAALHEAAPSAEVDVAPTLGQAQDLILNAKPDLFVLDVDTLPDVSQEFLYDLRTSHPNARAIVLTGGHFAAHQEQAAGLGAPEVRRKLPREVGKPQHTHEDSQGDECPGNAVALAHPSTLLAPGWGVRAIG